MVETSRLEFVVDSLQPGPEVEVSDSTVGLEVILFYLHSRVAQDTTLDLTEDSSRPRSD